VVRVRWGLSHLWRSKMSVSFACELPSESNPAGFKNFLKAPSSSFDFDVYKAMVYARGAMACVSQLALATWGLR
jgi:hypothetical protein